jgi:hypothetical protein
VISGTTTDAVMHAGAVVLVMVRVAAIWLTLRVCSDARESKTVYFNFKC